MELGICLAFLLGGLVVGGAGTWAWFRSNVVRLRADLGTAQEAEKARAGELLEARQDSDSWRDKHQAEQLERAKFEVENALGSSPEKALEALHNNYHHISAADRVRADVNDPAQEVLLADDVQIITEICRRGH